MQTLSRLSSLPRLVAWSLLAMLTTSPAWGQQLTLPANVSVDVNGQADVTAQSDCDSIRWIAPGNGLIVFEYGRHGGDYRSITVVGLVPGTYTVKAIGCKWDGKTGSKLTDLISTTITVQGSVPPPQPVPPVPPTPAVKNLFLLTIDDAKTRTQQTAQLLGNTTFWQSLESRGHKWAQLDANNASAAPFAHWVVKTGLPTLIVMTLDGLVLASVPLPLDPQSIEAIIAQFLKGVR